MLKGRILDVEKRRLKRPQRGPVPKATERTCLVQTFYRRKWQQGPWDVVLEAVHNFSQVWHGGLVGRAAAAKSVSENVGAEVTRLSSRLSQGSWKFEPRYLGSYNIGALFHSSRQEVTMKIPPPPR